MCQTRRRLPSRSEWLAPHACGSEGTVAATYWYIVWLQLYLRKQKSCLTKMNDAVTRSEYLRNSGGHSLRLLFGEGNKYCL